jgi:hypothetical protein
MALAGIQVHFIPSQQRRSYGLFSRMEEILIWDTENHKPAPYLPHLFQQKHHKIHYLILISYIFINKN